MSADCLFPGPNRRRKLGLQSSGRKIELIGAHHDIKILSGRLPETVKIQLQIAFLVLQHNNI
jgi:hypothetical protein